ncbi:MAG: conserved hypothetical protein, membrane [Candidatus Syntrophoarchaeum caldarius]|uniref:Uncharacterized protein n=1 Tax=Candidatus Syntropharchaeum caldarium TaxID=1838285 RepID=A0A1F2PBC3_9EURY|nr:MAG: conserved hypothetical protein, membrane [Candidatus Syntrophoarchaeum caldarius]
MSRFRLSKKLTSYEITLKLLSSIEDYLLTKVPKIINTNSNDIKKEYSISITDDTGTEEIESIKDYSLSSFPDFTEKIDISLTHYSPKILQVDIVFSDRLFSRIEVNYTGENAREITISIYEGILRILESSKTTNFRYHHSFIETSLFVSGAFLSGFAISSFSTGSYAAAVTAIILLLLIILYFVVGKRIHPYTLFESRRADTYKRWCDWFFYSVLGFILFDVVLMAILIKFYEIS